jgi:hypothetical protein
MWRMIGRGIQLTCLGVWAIALANSERFCDVLAIE